MQNQAPHCYFLPFDVCFEPASASTPPLFGFAEFLAIMALLLVVLTLSDFRYRFRLIVTRYDMKKVAFWTGFSIGSLLLLIDLWFYNGWPIPVALNNQNNIKFLLLLIFVSLVLYIFYIALINPPIFYRRNAKQYFTALYHFVGAGNRNEIAVIANELGNSASNIVDLAAKIEPPDLNGNQTEIPDANAYAHDALLLLGSPRLCEIMVANSPWTVVQFFHAIGNRKRDRLPIAQFCSNIGAQLLLNTDSALYLEDECYSTGLLGYTKPISKAVYGNFELVESLSSDYGSPLNLRYQFQSELKAENLGAYARASLIFCESYFTAVKARTHSYAFSQMLDLFERTTDDLYRLKGAGGEYWKTDEAQRLDITIRFIRDLITLLDKHDIPHTRKLKPSEEPRFPPGIHNEIANLIFEVIFDASTVTEPEWTCWSIQHNAVWADLFDYDQSDNWKVIKFKVRRLLYDEIRRMDDFPNFKGAKILGYCLNVLGLSEIRIRGYDQESNPLRLAAVAWAKRNYLALVEYSPNVAAACLPGRMEFNAEAKQIVKFYGTEISKEPKKQTLNLLDPSASTIKLWKD